MTRIFPLFSLALRQSPIRSPFKGKLRATVTRSGKSTSPTLVTLRLSRCSPILTTPFPNRLRSHDRCNRFLDPKSIQENYRLFFAWPEKEGEIFRCERKREGGGGIAGGLAAESGSGGNQLGQRWHHLPSRDRASPRSPPGNIHTTNNHGLMPLFARIYSKCTGAQVYGYIRP